MRHCHELSKNCNVCTGKTFSTPVDLKAVLLFFEQIFLFPKRIVATLFPPFSNLFLSAVIFLDIILFTAGLELIERRSLITASTCLVSLSFSNFPCPERRM